MSTESYYKACPVCRSEYTRMATRCIDCDVELVEAGALPPEEELQTFPPASELECVRVAPIQWIRALSEAGQLVVLATHDLDLAAQADSLLLLDAGRIVADGPPGDLLSDRGAWDAVGLVVPDWVRVDGLAAREAPAGERGQVPLPV